MSILGIGAIASLAVGFGTVFLTTHLHKRAEEEARAENRRPDRKPLWPLFVGMLFVIAGLGMGAGATGQSDQDRIDAACAKHGMDGFRQAFGHSGCLTKDGQVRYFRDVE